MQSGNPQAAISEEDDWDEDWDEETESDFFVISLASKMKLAGGAAFVIFLLLCSMIFNNFGFYYGAGNLTVLIDVNEGRDPGDRTLNANILATPPSFGMLEKEGIYTIYVPELSQVAASGSFEVSGEGRGSISVDYEIFFEYNGVYILRVELGSQQSSDSVRIERFADSVSGHVTNFDGDYPIDKDSPVIVNMQFLSLETESNYINPWVTGTVKIYHYENGFNEDQGESYWSDDSHRGETSENWNLVETIQLDVNSDSGSYTYSSGGTTDFYAVEIPPYNLNLILDVEKFYSEEGSGDYTLVFEFFNDLGDDNSLKEGRAFWNWFHLCQTKSDGKCDGNK